LLLGDIAQEYLIFGTAEWHPAVAAVQALMPRIAGPLAGWATRGRLGHVLSGGEAAQSILEAAQ